jgi:xyloglucan fucosyltransferase
MIMHADLPEDFKVGDPTLGGLLLPPEAYGEPEQCVSRSEEVLIRKPSPYLPSPYLISKLRKYEERHKRCAPKATEMSQNGSNSRADLGHCQFVIWIANSGLGNRMITITSAFVYALLTDRVLLLDHAGTDVNGLYCEPFPGTSWLLPESYDYGWISAMTWENEHKLGLYLQNGTANVTIPDPIPNNFIFVNLMHDYDDYDKRFFCNKIQQQLRNVPILYWRSNNYAVPGLHFDHAFHRELDLMFPERDTVFHHMLRYLFRPSNVMWGPILRFRQAYLKGSHRQVGLQLRILESNVTASVVADQVQSQKNSR